ncbi:MAG TPA: hypothetical protein DCK98_15795 [Chloroflexi bacterium]|nr:hypothetical protein [Chloroflexota bacterium]HAL25626.1 hypothetical protein [Chloroflexota bacterium]
MARRTRISALHRVLATAAAAVGRRDQCEPTVFAVGLNLAFPNEIGKPLGASNVLRRSFYPLLKRAGLPRVRFHDLRHSAASLLMGRGVNPKVVQELFGHSQIGVTLDLYSHVTPDDAARSYSSLGCGPRRSAGRPALDQCVDGTTKLVQTDGAFIEPADDDGCCMSQPFYGWSYR